MTKTVPVPTRVHLIGETAVIVGYPQRGWDEEGPDAHNRDAMGCSTSGPHVLARVPFTDERTLSQPEASAPVGVDAPGSREWMAEVCRAAALSLDAHGVHNDQLSKVADWIAQQPAAVDRARFRKAPCYLCGYNGAGYFQPETHPCSALYHAAQHQEPKS